MAQIDQQEFRDGQRNDWNEASKGWREWSELIDRSNGLGQRTTHGDGRRGARPAGCSTSPPATANRRSRPRRIVGPEGSVVATDISAGMLAYGRERAAAAGLQNVEFIESDAASLDFPPSSFDAAVSRWGIIFEPDGEGAAAPRPRLLEAGRPHGDQLVGTTRARPVHRGPDGHGDETPRGSATPPGTPGPLSRPTRPRSAACSKAAGSPKSRSRSWRSPSSTTRPRSSRAVPRRSIPARHEHAEAASTRGAAAGMAGGHGLRPRARLQGRQRASASLVLLAAGRA